MKGFLPFILWSDLISYTAIGRPLYYHAPMDRFPVEVIVMNRFKNGKLRIRGKYSKHGSFIVDESHLNRFMVKNEFSLALANGLNKSPMATMWHNL